MGKSRHSESLHGHHLEAFGAGLDHALHPFSSARSRKSQSVAGGEIYYSSAKVSNGAAAAASSTTFTLPCHHIRVGDIVILQQRPCQVIRITTSAHTGQHRYLGVDLFSKQLYEEPCVVSHPSPSVISHSMMGPVFKQYRLIDISENGRLTCMTETGEIKQGLRVVDQGQLYDKIRNSYGHGSGSVRVLILGDRGDELAVDYKIVHLGQKL